MTTLYHFTSEAAMKQIMAMGEILMTPSRYTGSKLNPVPVLWLSTNGGADVNADTIEYGLNLKEPVQGLLIDKVKARFTVEVPDDEVATWDEYCGFYKVAPHFRRDMGKWPIRTAWWVPFQRSIPASEWIEVGVASEDRNTWTPLPIDFSQEITQSDGD